MISKIQAPLPSAPHCEAPPLRKRAGGEFLSSITSLAPEKAAKRFLTVLLYPILWILNKIYSKIAPTQQEIEQFEDLLYKSVDVAVKFLDDPLNGEKGVKKVIASFSLLYVSLSAKWFSNLYGIWLMRVHIIELKLYLFALLGDDQNIEASHCLLRQLGCLPRENLKTQLTCLHLMRKKVFRPFFKVGHWLIRGLLGRLS